MNGTLSTAPADANRVNYWHQDSLGSIITVTNRDGAVIECMAFDAWGARETSNGAAAANVNPAHGDRGYTGHEHLDEIGLVHMNGRIYDPVLARFMSPDPVVGDPSDMQHYNRYAYVANSPLRYTDPSGNCPWCVAAFIFIVGHEMARQGNQYWRMVGTFAMMYATQGLVDFGMGVPGIPNDAINQAAGLLNTFNAGRIGNSFLAAAIPTLASGGTVEQAATAGIFAGAFTGVGTAFAGDTVKLVSAHMLLGCAQAAASGGACGPSALAAGFGKAATIGLTGYDLGYLGNGVVTAVVGGTASAIGGGKFTNGAKQAGFAYLFNCVATGCQQRVSELSQNLSDEQSATTLKFFNPADPNPLNPDQITSPAKSLSADYIVSAKEIQEVANGVKPYAGQMMPENGLLGAAWKGIQSIFGIGRVEVGQWSSDIEKFTKQLNARFGAAARNGVSNAFRTRYEELKSGG